MNCEQVKAALSAYYDRELDPSAVLEVERHLPTCGSCQAELESFRCLSNLIAASPVSQPATGNWNGIAMRLANETRSVTKNKDLSRLRPFVAASLALAASLLFLAVLNLTPTAPTTGNKSAAVAVDYSSVINLYAQRPSLALESLSKQFDGREFGSDKAETTLGFEPSIVTALPAGTRLVSAQALQMPNCDCAEGTCACGPSACNCAVCLCERQDGSKFLVVEHCKSQEVTFGDMQTQVATNDPQDIRFISGSNVLAASWITGDRRLTAIGLKNRAEAEVLVAAMDRASVSDR